MKPLDIVLKYILVAVVLLLLVGCANFPADGTPTTVREMSFQISFAGPINDNYFYMIPIDVQGGAQGPAPVFPNPGVPSGNEWVTGAATHFVQYHARQYTVYRITSLNPFGFEPIGMPVRSTLPSPGGTALSFTIDLNLIGATNNSLDVNIIALNTLIPDGRLLDGLGLQGNSFLNIDIMTDRTIRNSELAAPEPPGDVLNQNAVPQPSTDATRPLDIIDWVITTDV